MADLPYRIVIGLEVHVQLLTQTKLFCGCSTQFGLPPNSATCPVCIGMPGVLPVMNRRAFDLALRAALALNCQIAHSTKWDRKNYYYPDLPKNYQISQYDLPFSHDGWLEISTPDGSKRIGIIRVHLEEDAGKMLHDEHGTGKDSLVDLNRAGTPLLEIVSQPDLSSPEEAKAYLEEIRLLLREIGVSDCEMQEGSLRCDANINIHISQADGSIIKTPIVEVKNLNSFRAVERAMKFESQRQYEEALRDANYRLGKVSKATAGWDEVRGATVVQRRKEEASDYRYFPEPDLVPVVVEDAWLERARTEMGELPAAQRVRLVEQYGVSPYDAGVLTGQGRALVAYFEDAAKRSGDARAACNWIANQVLAALKERKIEIKDFPLSSERLAELIAEQKAIGLNKQMAGEVFNRMLESDCSAKQAIDALGIKPVADTGALVEIVRRALAANPKAVADFKAGKTKAAQAIKGAVMRETKGTARPEMVEQLILEEIFAGKSTEYASEPSKGEKQIPVVTFVFGLCGSGKSEVAKELASKGSEVLDEDSEFSCPPDGSLSPEKYARLREYLMDGKDCVVVEATLFFEPLRQQAVSYLHGIPNVHVKWIGFENDVGTANHNCMHRKNKGDGPGHVRINNNWTKLPYTFPNGCEIRRIYRLPV